MEKKFSILLIKIFKYFNSKPNFNGVFSRDNLPRIKDGTYAINFHDKESKETHWISLYVDGNTPVHFDLFGIEYIPQQVSSNIKDKSIILNIFRT